jgi:hypothetical protein
VAWIVQYPSHDFVLSFHPEKCMKKHALDLVVRSRQSLTGGAGCGAAAKSFGF